MLRRVCLGGLLLLSGCASLPFGGSSSESQYQRGWVSLEQDQYYLRGCHDLVAQPIERIPASLQRLYRQRSVSVPLYIEWIGQPGMEGEPTHIDQLRYVSPDPGACHQHLSEILMRAEGPSPGWQADITDSQIRVFLPQQRRTLVFPVGSVIRQGADWWWESDVQGRQRRHRLSLRIQPEACQDGHNWYGLTAVMELDGQEYTGCAKRGSLERLVLFREYRLDPSVTTRDIRLQLLPDGKAMLSEDYLNQQPPLVSRGQWQLLSGGRLLVSLDEPDPQLQQEALLFMIQEGGAVQLPGFHPRYGRDGLRLHATGTRMPWESGRRLVP